MNARRSIERLRGFRIRPHKSGALGEQIDLIEASLRRAIAGETKAQRAWRELAPAAIAARASTVSLRRGILVILARDSASKFEIDRWLRSGGEAPLKRACGAKRIKIEP